MAELVKRVCGCWLFLRGAQAYGPGGPSHDFGMMKVKEEGTDEPVKDLRD